jgi:L,D-transpeptidase catalytic domain
MSAPRLLSYTVAATASLFMVNCASQKKPETITKTGAYVNPYPEGSYDHFKAQLTYPKTYTIWKNTQLIDQTDPSNSSILISLAKQRGFLMNGETVVLDYPICSGIDSRPTPVGVFYILEKTVDKKSNKYGKMLDATGKVVNSDAEFGLDPIPEGGSFEGAGMRYWMRMTYDGVGHHIGPVKRYRASHACVRGPSAVMPLVFSKVKEGTRITVE